MGAEVIPPKSPLETLFPSPTGAHSSPPSLHNESAGSKAKKTVARADSIPRPCDFFDLAVLTNLRATV